MSLTFNLELDYKANKKGEKLLMIRCSQGRSHKRINTGIHLLPKYWDSTKKQVKKNHPLASEIGKTISKKMNDLEETYLVLLRDDVHNPVKLTYLFRSKLTYLLAGEDLNFQWSNN